MEILKDGLPHRLEELHACLWDEQGPVTNAQMHISNLRKILRPQGQDILCQQGNGSFYRLVRLLGSPHDGIK